MAILFAIKNKPNGENITERIQSDQNMAPQLASDMLSRFASNWRWDVGSGSPS